MMNYSSILDSSIKQTRRNEMKVELKIQTAIKSVIITDEHAASSYGIPVAVVDGEAYGPHDELPIWPNDELRWLVEMAKVTVSAACIEMRKNGALSEKEVEFIRRFYE